MATLKRESFSKCIAEVAAKAGVDEDTAFGIIKDVAAYGDTLRKTGAPNPFGAAAEELAKREAQGAIQTRKSNLRNALIHAKYFQRLLAETDHLTGPEAGKARANFIRSILTFTPGSKTYENVESMSAQLHKVFVTAADATIKKAGLREAALSGQYDKEAIEMERRANGLAPDNSIVISPQAKIIHDAIFPTMETARLRLNDVGANIGKAQDFFAHMNWDQDKLRQTAPLQEDAFKIWWKDAQRWADPKTFEHIIPNEGETSEEAKLRFAKSFYEATVSGVHKQGPGMGGLYDDGADGYIPPSYEGSRNLGRRLSQQRVFFFKDAQSQLEAMQKYGTGRSLYASTQDSLVNAARQIALMTKLGDNPRAMYNKLIDSIKKKWRTKEELDAFSIGLGRSNIKLLGSTDDILNRLDGTANIPKHELDSRIAGYFNAFASLESGSKLGGVGPTHLIAAPWTVTSELAQHGISHWEGLGHLISGLLSGKGSEEMQTVRVELNAYTHGIETALRSKFNPDGGIPGYTTWAMTNYMKLTLLPHLLQKVQSEAVTNVLSAKLGSSLEKEFSQLNPNQAQIMKRYGLGPEEWDLLRKVPNDRVIEGNKYLTPKAADSVDEAQVKAILTNRGLIGTDTKPEFVDKAVQRFKWDLADKYNTYLSDAARRSTITPGANEQALFMGSSTPGTRYWVAGRLLGQFKMWPVAMVHQVLMRDMALSLSKGQLASNFAWIFSLATAGGILRMMLNDATAGRPQRNYMNPNNLIPALAKGGGFGMYGDMLFGETARASNFSFASPAGPIGQDAEDLTKSFIRFRDDLTSPNGETQDKAVQHLWASALRGGIEHTPGANLVYLKGALDYMAFYHMYEAASPGWWERTNRRLQRNQQNVMMGYQPGEPIPYGIPPFLTSGNK